MTAPADVARRRALVAGVAVAAVVVAGGLFLATREPEPPPPRQVTPARYTLWMAIGGAPSESDLEASAGHDAIVVLNQDRIGAARQLRARDPQVSLYPYLDLSSVRTYDNPQAATVTGVSQAEAEANGWLALDPAGQPIEWDPYPGHLQTQVWNPSYQDAWTRQATQVGLSPPWNGVFADNDLTTLSHYSDRTIAGLSGRGETDALLMAGQDELITKAGTGLNAEGRDLWVNISDGRRDHARWQSHARFGGGLVEHFMSWSRSGRPDLTSSDGGAWLAEAQLIGLGPRTAAITTAAVGDERTCLFGYASFLLFARPGDGWQCAPGGDYSARHTIPETGIALGLPVGRATERDGLWQREFEGGWVAVNPTRQPMTVDAPDSAWSSDGKRLHTVRLPALTGVVAELR